MEDPDPEQIEGGYSRVRARVALTFDDVLLTPGHSQLHPRDVSTASRVTRGITLNIPLLSAAMDTVSVYSGLLDTDFASPGAAIALTPKRPGAGRRPAPRCAGPAAGPAWQPVRGVLPPVP